MDNPFSSYLSEPGAPAARPQGKRRRRRRREAEPQTIGKNPETLPIDAEAEPEVDRYDDDDYVPPAYDPPPVPTAPHDEDDGYTGDWNDWTTTDDEPA